MGLAPPALTGHSLISLRVNEAAALPSPAVVLSARLDRYYDRLRRRPGRSPTSRLSTGYRTSLSGELPQSPGRGRPPQFPPSPSERSTPSTPGSSSRLHSRFCTASMAFALRDGARLSLIPPWRARSRRGRLRLMLRTGRCQLHKIRNGHAPPPEKLRTTVPSRMRRAYHADSALAAEAELCALAAELDRTHPGAAASLREGVDETLTVLRLGIPPTLARTFRSTNAVESMISICRTHASNVKNWRDGTMALRWCAAGMVEAGKQFRRVNGHMHLRSLRDTLERITQPVGATSHTDAVSAA